MLKLKRHYAYGLYAREYQHLSKTPSSGHRRFLSTPSANALVKSLIEVNPTSRTRRARKSRARDPKFDQADPSTRVDIVSESLCDDIISYLSPTLSQHVGCTLIDLQPGACLFSSKLHEVLKPKQHLLVETDEYYFKPFIKPLVDQADSRYRYTPIDIAHSSSYWSEIERILHDPNLLPSTSLLSRDDPRRNEFNPGILVVGNITRPHPIRTQSHSVQLSKLMLHQFGHHALSRQYLQSVGLVRMLLWVPEIRKTDIYATLPWRRNGHNIGLNFAFQISETVSVHSLGDVYQNQIERQSLRRTRSPALDILNQRDVQYRMQNLGVRAPKGRQLQVEDILQDNDNPAGPISPLHAGGESVDELLTKIDTASSRIEEIQTSVRNKRPTDRAALEALEFPQLALDAERHCHKGSQTLQKPSIDRLVVLADLVLTITRIEANLKSLEDRGVGGAILEDLIHRIHALNQTYNELLEKASPFMRMLVHNLVDDHMVYHLSPSILAFYERSYEPLKANADDFWPEKGLSLFDFMPKERDLAVPDLASSEEAARFCSELMQILFSSNSLTLPQALDRVGVNAAQDLIPMVPAITDARKGGRLDPNNVRVRMVTEEMLEGLVKAFFEWPFRPQSWELALDNDGPAAKEEEPNEDSAV